MITQNNERRAKRQSEAGYWNIPREGRVELRNIINIVTEPKPVLQHRYVLKSGRGGAGCMDPKATH